MLGPQSPELLTKLLALRAETKQLTKRQWARGRSPSAKELNESNQKMFNRAAALLGPNKFELIFGFSPSQKINLVDPRYLIQKATKTGKTEGPFVARRSGEVHSRTATTVTLKDLAASLAEDNELSKKQAGAILGGLVGQIVEHLKKGQRIRIGGLGILQVRKLAARMGRNPATGEAIQIKAGKKVAFRAAKDLKEAIPRQL